jgi:hypothetical protein
MPQEGRTMPDAPATEPTTEPTTEPPAAATTPPTPAPPAEPTDTGTKNPWEDPAAAQAEIERLRKENAKDRTNAKAQAAEDARKELANTIGKALGLVEDGTETDPAKLTESLTTAQAEAKRARVELAVFKSAAAAGGDPAALLDSSSFLASLEAIDPSDSAAVQAAIASAVETNPRLGAAPAGPKPPAPNPAQGASASGAPAGVDQLTREQVENLARDGKYAEIDKAREEGRLNNLLGIKP